MAKSKEIATFLPSSVLRQNAESWRRGPNAVHNQSDSRTRVGVRRTTMVVYRAAFVAMTVEFIQAPIQDLLTRCSATVCASMQRSSVFRSSLMVSRDSSTYWSGTHTELRRGCSHDIATVSLSIHCLQR